MKRILKIIALLVAVSLLLMMVLYATTDPPNPVLPTVSDDPQLPAVEIGGVRLHAEAFGDPDAPVVIVLHGGPGNDYRALLSLKALADSYRVVFYDQRGAGLSQRLPIEDLTIDGYIEELAGVARHFAGERPVHLVGHSWGAMLASGFISRYPGRVISAVLAEPGFLTSATAEDFLRNTNGMQPPLSGALLTHLVNVAMKSLKVDGPDDHARADYFVAEFIMGADIEDHPMAKYFCDGKLESASLDMWRFGSAAMMASQGLADENGKITIDLVSGAERFAGPVLFLTSACNQLIGAAHQEKHLGFFAHATQEIVAEAGHSMFGEKPEETTAIVRQFLGRAGQPDATP